MTFELKELNLLLRELLRKNGVDPQGIPTAAELEAAELERINPSAKRPGGPPKPPAQLAEK